MTSASTGSLAFDAVVETLVLRRTCSSVPPGVSKVAAHATEARTATAQTAPLCRGSVRVIRLPSRDQRERSFLNFDQFRYRAIDIFNPHCQPFARVELLLGNLETRRDHAVFRPVRWNLILQYQSIVEFA